MDNLYNIIVISIVCLIFITLYYIYFKKNYNSYNLIFISCLLIIALYGIYQYLNNEKNIQIYEHFRINADEEPDEIMIHPDNYETTAEEDDPLNKHNFTDIETENYNNTEATHQISTLPITPPMPTVQSVNEPAIHTSLPTPAIQPAQPSQSPTPSTAPNKEPGTLSVGDIQQTNARNGNVFMPQVVIKSNEGEIMNMKKTTDGYVWNPNNNINVDDLSNLDGYDPNDIQEMEKYYKQNNEDKYTLPYRKPTRKNKRFNPVDYYAGYAIMPPKYWDTFRPKPPPCIPDKWVRPSAVFTSGTPVNVLELDEEGKMLIDENNTTYTNVSRDKKNVSFTNVGSILPRGEYKEYYNY